MLFNFIVHQRLMRHRRSKIDLVSQILEAANSDDGATKTKIMYKAYLRDPSLKEYLSILTESDLLSYALGNNKFKITKKGRKFLDIYDRLFSAMKTQKINVLIDRERT